jgi:formiminotetrahydrofolate cyclodeaminase
MLPNQTLNDVLAAFSSSDPTPGGGSAAALAGALGASLLAMVAGLSKTRTGAPGERAALDRARAELVAIRNRLVALIDRDAEAYDRVVAAYRLPKTSDEERAARRERIQEALTLATTVPLDTLRASNDALQAGRTVAEQGNPSAASDVTVGVELLMAAVRGAWLNIGTNLGSLTDPEATKSVRRDVQEFATSSGEAIMGIYRSGSVKDLMTQSAERLGSPHGRPPGGLPDRLVPPAIELLARIGTMDARRALQIFARSRDRAIATAARAALGRPAAPGRRGLTGRGRGSAASASRRRRRSGRRPPRKRSR